MKDKIVHDGESGFRIRIILLVQPPPPKFLANHRQNRNDPTILSKRNKLCFLIYHLASYYSYEYLCHKNKSNFLKRTGRFGSASNWNVGSGSKANGTYGPQYFGSVSSRILIFFFLRSDSLDPKHDSWDDCIIQYTSIPCEIKIYGQFCADCVMLS